ncbi:MAG: hypothetical protein MNSN_04930 [Minisyncoccus archaeiphilus]|uniref:site-specific DNA-methyltransferase n=1 Tax=Minisyncoccus archaeiphilus TaxID=3238481 RepID=UPI002B1835AD|nr:MAG: hypothetical protein MNSN_04930 [Candidatus Parcubacteria bacterium]
MKKLREQLKNLLKENEAFFNYETKDLKFDKIKDSADKIDESLISLLIQEKEIREKFFVKIKDVYVFKVKEFVNP